MPKVMIEQEHTTTYTLTITLDRPEAVALERHLSEHTGPSAPDAYKEIIRELRGVLA